MLNGASSAGKTLLARELQRLLPEPHLVAGIDSFSPMLRPEGHIGMLWPSRTNENAGGPEAPVRWVFPEREGDPVRLEFGTVGHRMVRGMHLALVGLAAAGNDVIFDHVFLYPEWASDLLNALRDYDVYFVGVHCPIEVIEERERARGTRVPGQARAHYETCHANMVYDVEVDTSAMSSLECAEAIAARLAGGPGEAAPRMRVGRELG